MSALFAFEVGDVSMRSATFERVIEALMERSSEPVHQQVCTDALELNCMWVDQIDASHKCPILKRLRAVLEEQLQSGYFNDNDVAIFEINQVLMELTRRYPECLGPRGIK